MKTREKWILLVVNNEEYWNFRKIENFYIIQGELKVTQPK